MAGAQQPPFQQISQVYSFEGLLTPTLIAGLFAKPGERRSKETGTLRERERWASSKTLPCASRETSWLAGSTHIGKAAPSDKKAISKSDWSDMWAYISLFSLLKCKIQFFKWISDSHWKDFSTHSSQLLIETLKGKAVQVPTPSDLLGSLPGQSPGGCHSTKSCLQRCCIGGCIWADVPKLLTLSSTQREPERRNWCRWSRKQFPFRIEKQQTKAYFFCYCPLYQKNLPAIMSQSPSNNVL